MDNLRSRHEDIFGGNLEERVKLWQQSIQPHLEAQEKRPAFDIQLHSRNIVELIEKEVTSIF